MNFFSSQVTSADDVYRSKLWYCDIMSFLSAQEALRVSTSNLDVREESILEVGKTIYSHCLSCIIYFNINYINFIKIVLYCIIRKTHFI